MTLARVTRCLSAWLVVSPVLAQTNVCLRHLDLEYSINAGSGSLAGAQQAGEPFIEPSSDAYVLMVAGSTEDRLADETSDRVLEKVVGPDGRQATFTCRNEALGLQLVKTYWIEGATGLLFKRVEASATGPAAGYLVFDSGLSVPRRWWTKGIPWHPVSHTWADPFVPADSVTDLANLAPNNGCTAFLALYRPDRGRTLVHYRWGGQRFEHFESYTALPPYGKRVWPRRWALGGGQDFIEPGSERRAIHVMVYGLTQGSPLQVYLQYAAREEYLELALDPADGAPEWLRDTIVSDDMDLLSRFGDFSPEKFRELLSAALSKKLFFGFVQATFWGAFPCEYYIARPEDAESTSSEDPVKTAEWVAFLKEASPRLKVGLYTHYGSPCAHTRSRLAKLAGEQGWLDYDRDGNVFEHVTEYSGWVTDPPSAQAKVAVGMTWAAEGYREYLKRRFGAFFDCMKVDFMYADAASKAGIPQMSWKPPHYPTPRTAQELYADLLKIAVRKGGAFFMNQPNPIGSAAGYSEFQWYDCYRRDWRIPSARLATDQALNTPGRRLYLAAQPSLARTGSPQEDGVRLHLNLVSMLGLGYSLLDTYQIECKERFYKEAPPYLQGAYELRNRALVDARLQPDFWDLSSDTEAHAWRMPDGYGLVTVMNHRSEAVEQEIAFDTSPMGLRAGRPALVWRMEMADPRQVDFSGVTWETPVARLATQDVVRIEQSLPERLTVRLKLPPENPVLLMISQTPAAIVSVEGRPCQYWLPAAYGVAARGTLDTAGELVTVGLANPIGDVELLVMVPQGARETPSVTQKRPQSAHPAGVAWGELPVDCLPLDVNGHRFVRLAMPKGDTEIAVR